jgi:hypothetical protein
MLFGSNVIKGHNQNIYRIYNGPALNVPAGFPGGGNKVPQGIVPYVSFRPDITAVNAGTLDQPIRDYFTSAPAGSLITAWHEGNLPKHRLDPATVTTMHARLLRLAREANPHIFYGEVFGTYRVYTSGQQLAEWTAPGLDFYGFDGYQAAPQQTVQEVFGEAVSQVLKAIKFDGKLIITETNVQPAAIQLHQEAWLTAVLDYAIQGDFAGFLWYEESADNAAPIPVALANRLGIMAAVAPLGRI